ncbi:MAG: phenylacetate--CoA ligase family protein [Thermodesulfobacteriota bacterium]
MKKRKTTQHLASKKKVKKLDRVKILSKKLVDIVSYAYRHAPAFRAKMDRAGVTPSDIKTLKDLDKVPVTPQSEMVSLQKENPPFGGFLTVPIEKLERIFVSPGPLYEPMRIGDFAKNAAEALSVFGLKRGDRVLNTFSYHMVPAGLGVDQALRLLGATVIPAGVGLTDLQVKIMKELKVTGYVGTPSFLMTLIKRAEEMGLEFRREFSLQYAVCSAEILPPSMRRSFEEDYGLKVADTYGSAILGILGYECEQKSGFHFPESLIMEIVDPLTGRSLGPGEIGEVVVTLFDKTYPLIRFGTGDLSSFTDEPCACGRKSHRLTRIMGRVGDAVKVRGMFIHSKQVEEVIQRFPEVSRFQVQVSRLGHRDEWAINLELKEEVDREKLSESLQKSIQESCHVKPDKIEFVSPGTIAEGAVKIVDQRTWE